MSDNRFWGLILVGGLSALGLTAAAAIVALQVTQKDIDRGLATILIAFLTVIGGQIVTHVNGMKGRERLESKTDKLDQKVEQQKATLETVASATTKLPDVTEQKP